MAEAEPKKEFDTSKLKKTWKDTAPPQTAAAPTETQQAPLPKANIPHKEHGFTEVTGWVVASILAGLIVVGLTLKAVGLF